LREIRLSLGKPIAPQNSHRKDYAHHLATDRLTLVSNILGLTSFAIFIFTIGILQGGANYSSYLWPVDFIFNPLIKIFLYFLALNSIPLIVLKPYLKRKQKIAWIISESISHAAFTIGTLWIALSCAFPNNYYSKTELSIRTLYDLGACQILAVSMVIWIAAAAFQLYMIKFKHPKYWLICTISTWATAYLILCVSFVWIERNPVMVGIIMGFMYGIFTPSLTGLGLYFSGMSIRESRTIQPNPPA
jgi:hypothetical protein